MSDSDSDSDSSGSSVGICYAPSGDSARPITDWDYTLCERWRRLEIDDTDTDIEQSMTPSYNGFLKPNSADFDDNSVFSKNHPSTSNNFTWVDGSNVITSMTYDEFGAHQKYLKDLICYPPGWDDPRTYKQDSEDSCIRCFPVIQEQFPEMADCELVETMGGCSFVGGGGGYAHVNFKAKHKDDRDSSVYFAEFNFTERKVTCFTKLHTSCAGTYGYERSCDHCHPEKPFPYADYVYHPDKKVNPWREGCF